jgi:transposase-like protein
VTSTPFGITFATRWLANGGDPVTLSKLMGTSVEMIARSYGHLDPNWVRQIQDRMRGKNPKNTEVRDRPRVPYAQYSPKAPAI